MVFSSCSGFSWSAGNSTGSERATLIRGWRRSWRLGRHRNNRLNARSKRMKHTLVRIAIGVPAAFNALSAIGGGIVLLAGTYKDGILIEREGKPSSRWSGYKTRRSAI